MLNSSAKLGLVVSPSGATLSFCEKNGKILQQEELAQKIDFGSSELTGLAPAIQTLVNRFSQQIKRADNTVCLALPDACFQQSQFEFEDFPSRKKEAMDLVTWRHCNELSLRPENVAVGYRKAITMSSGKTNVLAQSIPKAVVSACQDALWESSLVADQIDSLGSYLVANLRAKKSNGWGTVFWCSKDWWSFRVVNKYGEMEPQFGAWSTDESDAALVARRFNRVMNIYKQQTEEDPSYVHLMSMKGTAIDQVEAIAKEMNVSILRTEFDNLKTPSKIVAVVR